MVEHIDFKVLPRSLVKTCLKKSRAYCCFQLFNMPLFFLQLYKYEITTNI